MSSGSCSCGICRPPRAEAASKHSHTTFPRPSSVPFRKELVNTVYLIGKLEENVNVRMLAGQQAVANVWLAAQKSTNVREPPSWYVHTRFP
jgi:hypothetical protein